MWYWIIAKRVKMFSVLGTDYRVYHLIYVPNILLVDNYEISRNNIGFLMRKGDTWEWERCGGFTYYCTYYIFLRNYCDYHDIWPMILMCFTNLNNTCINGKKLYHFEHFIGKWGPWYPNAPLSFVLRVTHCYIVLVIFWIKLYTTSSILLMLVPIWQAMLFITFN